MQPKNQVYKFKIYKEEVEKPSTAEANIMPTAKVRGSSYALLPMLSYMHIKKVLNIKQ